MPPQSINKSNSREMTVNLCCEIILS